MRSAVCCLVLAILSVNTVWAGNEEDGSQMKERKHDQGGKFKDGGDRHDMMKAADKDGDGKITKDEFISTHLEMLNARFEAMDKDGDGVITEADREAARKERESGAGGAGAGKMKKDGGKERKGQSEEDRVEKE